MNFGFNIIALFGILLAIIEAISPIIIIILLYKILQVLKEIL